MQARPGLSIIEPATHAVFADLCALGLSNAKSVTRYYPKVRDRDDIFVLRCEQSGVFLLSRCDHIDASYYEDQQELSYWNTVTPRTAVLEGIEDLDRRSQDLRYVLANKRWL